MKSFRLILAAVAALVMVGHADAQTANGRATTAAPTYTNNSAQPLSLDLAGGLRVNCVTGCGGGGGGGAVDITAVGGNAVTTTVPVSGSVGITGALPAGANNIGDVDVLTLPSIPAGTNNIGDVDVLTLPALPAGNNNIGDVDIASGTLTTVSTVTSVTGATVIPATTTAGTSSFSLIAANTTNATNVKNGAGTLFEISVYNNSATIAYLKFYNSASAPTCGSGTPVARYLIPGASAGGAGSNVVIPLGKTFATGIGFCLTTGIADADTGAVAATTYLVNLTYK